MGQDLKIPDRRTGSRRRTKLKRKRKMGRKQCPPGTDMVEQTKDKPGKNQMQVLDTIGSRNNSLEIWRKRSKRRLNTSKVKKETLKELKRRKRRN